MSEFRLKLREDRPATITERRALIEEIKMLRRVLNHVHEYGYTNFSDYEMVKKAVESSSCV